MSATLITASIILQYLLAAYAWCHTRRYPEVRWGAAWMTLLASSATLQQVAPPASPAYYTMQAAWLISVVGLVMALQRLPRVSKRNRAEVMVTICIGDATAYPPRPRTPDASRAVLEGVENAIEFLGKFYAERDYKTLGPDSQSLTWRWQRDEESAACTESLAAFAQLTYTMLFAGAAKAAGFRLKTGVSYSIHRPSLVALMHFLAYNEAAAKLFVAPMPYSQAEYREAIEQASRPMLAQL